MATLVTRFDMDDEIVDALSVAILESTKVLTEELPVLRKLEKTVLEAPDLGVPSHPAAHRGQ